jgi:hypothetical protein
MQNLNHDFKLRNLGVTNAVDSINRARHRWYYYKEGFSPVLVEKAIELSDLGKGDVILDPFNGSGTTTLTASTKGYSSIGIEVNPFTSFLAGAKTKGANISQFDCWSEKIVIAAKKGCKSRLIGYSTFSKTAKSEKWLFNDEVLRSFEGGWEESSAIGSHNLRGLIRLALISSAMQNCNAKRDGKCLRYTKTWAKHTRDSNTYIASLEGKLAEIKRDIETEILSCRPTIINGDARKELQRLKEKQRFKLCVTSPPYLNTFDYTDIYRPELFLGHFVNNTGELYKLRLRTVRSHIQATWQNPKKSDFGSLYDGAIDHVKRNSDELMDKRIPLMIQAYFEDMAKILSDLRDRAADGAQAWLVVSNSAYADKEIPVDLIIADIGSSLGWKLKDVAVLENIKRRKSKYSPSIDTLRESLIIFENAKQ